MSETKDDLKIKSKPQPHNHAHGHSNGQSHGHSNGHSHGHSHSHSHAGTLNRIGLAFFINLIFAIIEIFGGFYTNSIAILSDALHDFGDAVAIGLSWMLEKWSQKSSDQSYSYGYRRFSTLAAVVTGVILLCGSVVILSEAIPRLMNPTKPDVNGMFGLAILGIAVNGYAAWKVSQGSSLNERMIMLHLIEDVLGWVLVLVGAIVMKFFDMPRVDAIMACVLSFWMLFNVFKNLREAMRVFLQGMPAHFEMSNLESAIRKLENIQDLHHSHIWSLDGEKHIFTTHVVLDSSVGHAQIDFVKEKIKEITASFGILEATIEIEFSNSKCVDPSHTA